MSRSQVQSIVARYLRAAPLDDYHSMSSPTEPPTLGWGRENDPNFLAEATAFFESRRDSWAIVIRPEEMYFEAVRAYVANNPKLRRSKIIVVASDAMDGDETAPNWIVIHDIIGHSISTSKGLSFPFVWALHAVLPSKYRITRDPEDLAPDVYAAVFFKANLTKLIEDATDTLMESYIDPSGKAARLRANWVRFHRQALVDEEEKFFELLRKNFDREFVRTHVRGIVAELLENVAEWSSKFKPGVPKTVYPW